MRKKIKLQAYKCYKCNHEWYPRKSELPATCPRCRNPKWNIDTKKQLIKKLKQEVYSRFSKIEKVKKVLFQEGEGELLIYVYSLLSTIQYDGDLMEILLGIEYDIKKKYSNLEIVLKFFYAPENGEVK